MAKIAAFGGDGRQTLTWLAAIETVSSSPPGDRGRTALVVAVLRHVQHCVGAGGVQQADRRRYRSDPDRAQKGPVGPVDFQFRSVQGEGGPGQSDIYLVAAGSAQGEVLQYVRCQRSAVVLTETGRRVVQAAT